MYFISHSSLDNAAALDVRDRLLARGYDAQQIFLDSDEDSGIAAGRKWEQMLYEQLKDCRALIMLCSPHWQKSKWCFAELVYAKMAGKEVFPIVLADCDLSVASEHQAVFVNKEGEAAYLRLFDALEARHLGPKDHLPWPHPALRDVNGKPDNCPYPGLPAFDERYAAVYFGREREIQAVLEDLRQMRRTGEPRLLMIVGSSGSGKSSLLMAGVLPRLKHTTARADWLVLSTLRFGRRDYPDALFESLAEEIVARYPSDTTAKRISVPDRKTLRDQLAAADSAQAAKAFLDAARDLSFACGSKDATVLLPVDQFEEFLVPTALLPKSKRRCRARVDQFEEFLVPTAKASGTKFLRFMEQVCQHRNDRLLVIGTMRSDYLDIYERHPHALKAPTFYPWRLEPFPREKIENVIVKPAARTHVEITPELLEQLKQDTPTTDALPLLSFTLEKLYRGYAADKQLDLSEYKSLGGMEGAIKHTAEQIMPAGSLPPNVESAVRLSFVTHLAQVNEKDEVVRLTARWEDLDPVAYPILEQFVAKRLLIKSGRDGEVTVEVAHEALFRSWEQLKGWLGTSADILRWRRDVRRDQASDEKWRGLRPSQLAVARDWRKRRRDDLSDDEVTWIKRGIRRQWLWSGIVTTVVLVVAASAGTAWRQKVKADAANNVLSTKNDELVKATERANQEADRANTELRRAEGLVYANTVASAQREWEAGNSGPAWTHLDAAQGDLRGWEHDYLFSRFNQNQTTLRAHKKPVFRVAMSGDGRLIVSGGFDDTVKVWDASRGDETLMLERHTARVTSVALSTDGQRIVSGYADGMVKVWDASSGEEALALKQHMFEVTSVTVSTDGKRIVSGSSDGTVKVWDAFNGEVTAIYKVQGSSVSSIALNANGLRIASGSSDGTVKVWNVLNGDVTLTLNKYVNDVDILAQDANGQRILNGSWGDLPFVWNALTKQETATFGLTNFHVSVALSADGQYIVSGSSDSTVKVWDASNGKETRAFRENTDGVRSVALSADGQRIVVGGWDGTVKVWDVLRAQETLRLKGHTAAVTSVAANADGLRIVSGSSDGTVKIWDASSSQETLTLTGHTDSVVSVALSADGRRIVSGSADQTVKVWDAPSGQVARTLEGHTARVTSVALSADGKHIVSGSWDRTVKVWDASNGQEAHTLEGHTARVTSVAMSADGQQIVSGSWDGTVKIWDTSSGKETLTLKGHTDGVEMTEARRSHVFGNRAGILCIALSADGQRVVSGSQDGTVRVWDASSGDELITLLGHTARVNSVALSADGNRIISGSLDGTVQVWNAWSGEEILMLRGSTDEVTSVILSTDGKRIVSGSSDGTVQVWDASTGQKTLTLMEHTARVTSVAFSADARLLVSGSDDRTLKVWNAGSRAKVAAF